MSLLNEIRKKLLGQAQMDYTDAPTQGLIGTGGEMGGGLLNEKFSGSGNLFSNGVPSMALLGSAIYSQGLKGQDPFAALFPAYGQAQQIESLASKNAANQAAIKSAKRKEQNLEKLMESDLISPKDKMFLAAGLKIPENKTKMSTFTQDAINAGFPPGSPEYQQLFIENVTKNKGIDVQFNPDGTVSSITSGTKSGDLELLKQKKAIPIQIKNEDKARKLQTTYGTLETIITGMQKQVDSTPTGAVGGIISGLDYVKDQFAQVKDLTIPSSFAGKASRDADKFLANSGISKASQDYARFKSSAINLAYLLAEIKEPGNPKYSEGDIERQFARFRLGGSRGQIKAALQQVLEDEYRISTQKYKGLMPDGDFGYTLEGVDLETIEKEEDKKKQDILGYYD
jgi:hypothetical protein